MSVLVCEPCTDDGKQFEAFGFCLDCCEYLCEECYLYHRKPRQTRNHTLLDKEQVRQQKDSLPTKDAIKDTCRQHSEENVKYFCQTHDIPGCAVCITTDHRLCEDVVHVPQVSKGIADSEECSDLATQIDETTKRLQAIIPAATANITKSKINNIKVIKEIVEFRDDIFATINRLATSAQAEAKQCNETDTQRMNAIIIKSKDGLRKIHAMKAGMQNLERLGRENKLFLAVKTNKKDAQEIQEELTEWESNNTVRICRFESNANLRRFLRSVDRLGGISDITVDASDFIKWSSTEDAEQTGTVSEAIKAAYLGDAKSIYIRSENEQSVFSNVTAIAVFEQNKLVVVSCTDTSKSYPVTKVCIIQVVDTKRNRTISELVLNVLNWCNGMVKINESNAALNIESIGTVLYRVGTTLVADKQLYSYGDRLKLSSFDNTIYVCDRSQRIVRVDMNGHKADAVVSQEVNKELQYFKACALYETRGITYMYAIVVIERSTFLGHGPTNKKITDKVDLPVVPTSLVMSDDRKLLFIVTGENDNAVIYVLRTGSTDARVLLSKKDGLNGVAAICYCAKKKQLFVAAPKCNFVKVYQLSGVA